MDTTDRPGPGRAADKTGRSGPPDDIIAGRGPVGEALRSGRPIDSVLIARGDKSGTLRVLVAQCRERRIPVKESDPRKLEGLAGPHHQGIVAIAACKEPVPLETLFDIAEERGEPPFLVVCDELEDPHNLGAILRTAEAAGAHGVVIPGRRSAGLTTTVYKASAGAAEYIPVARVSNLTQALQDMKKRGVWIYGLEMDGTAWCDTEMTGPVALVVGSEGRGLGRLVREQCDFFVSLPMAGKMTSLNASVACGIVLYEIARQRTASGG